jgi:hypothetical protein
MGMARSGKSGGDQVPQWLKPVLKTEVLMQRWKRCSTQKQLGAQGVDDGGYVVFLEEADGGDASGTGFEAGLRIL